MSQASFFDLPAELRLEVYDHLVTDCLADGFASDLRGLFASCKQVHREMGAEFSSKIWVLLRSKLEWDATMLSDKSLRMQIGCGSNFCNALKDITVTLPMVSSWSTADAVTCQSNKILEQLIQALRPAC